MYFAVCILYPVSGIMYSALWGVCACYLFWHRRLMLSQAAIGELRNVAEVNTGDNGSSRSCWPSHLGTCLGAGDFGLCNSGCKYCLKRVGDAFWGAAFYDVSIRQAVAQQLRKTAWARLADIVSQPNRIFAEVCWKGPMRNESWICCFALDPM